MRWYTQFIRIIYVELYPGSIAIQLLLHCVITVQLISTPRQFTHLKALHCWLQYWCRWIPCTDHKPGCTEVHSCDRNNSFCHTFHGSCIWPASAKMLEQHPSASSLAWESPHVRFCGATISTWSDQDYHCLARSVPSGALDNNGTSLHRIWVGVIQEADTPTWTPPCYWTWLLFQSPGYFRA